MLPLVLALAGWLTPVPPVFAGEQAPPLMLAKVYRSGVSLPDYWVSEKYDGVRGYCYGEKLLTLAPSAMRRQPVQGGLARDADEWRPVGRLRPVFQSRFHGAAAEAKR